MKSDDDVPAWGDWRSMLEAPWRVSDPLSGDSTDRRGGLSQKEPKRTIPDPTDSRAERLCIPVAG